MMDCFLDTVRVRIDVQDGYNNNDRIGIWWSVWENIVELLNNLKPGKNSRLRESKERKIPLR